MTDVTWSIEIIDDCAKSGTIPFPAARRNLLIDRSKSTKGRAAFILPSKSVTLVCRSPKATPTPKPRDS
jgi:hypothetical protein